MIEQRYLGGSMLVCAPLNTALQNTPNITPLQIVVTFRRRNAFGFGVWGSGNNTLFLGIT